MREVRHKKKNQVGNILWWVAITLCIALFVSGALCFILYYIESNEVAQVYAEIADIHDSALEDPMYAEKVDQQGVQVIVKPGASEKNYLLECQELYQMNNDLVGWISFPETVINYPVLQTETYNRDFYLRRDFHKNYSRYGCIYAAEDCDVFEPSDNVTLYGHHMSDGSMFATLLKYEEKGYWESHQVFTFDTLYEHHTYQIIAAFKIRADSDFRYHMFTNAESEDEFNEFMNNIYKRQYYDTGVTVKYGDKILCLSTCEYTLGDGRFVVVAKRIS